MNTNVENEVNVIISDNELMQFFRQNAGKTFRKQEIAEHLASCRMRTGTQMDFETLTELLLNRLYCMRLRDLPHIKRLRIEEPAQSNLEPVQASA